MKSVLALVVALAVPAYAERLAPERDLLEGCSLPVARDKVVPIADEIQFKLSARDRIEIGRAIKEERFGHFKNGEADGFKKAFDRWEKAGAKMHVRQAVRVPFDLERGPDRIAVVELDAGMKYLGVVAAPQKRWVSLFNTQYDATARFVAAANIDDDAWTELLFFASASPQRKPWWLTAQTRVDPDWPHVEHAGDGTSLSGCSMK